MNIGVVCGSLTIGGMEVSACRLARVLSDLGHKTWVAYRGLDEQDAHSIGKFIADEGVEFVAWSEVANRLTDCKVVWLSQSQFISNPEIVKAIANTPWSLEYFGQPPAMLPEKHAIVPDFCVGKTRHVTTHLQQRKQDATRYLTMLGIPIEEPNSVTRISHSGLVFSSISRMDYWQKRLHIVIEAAHELVRRGYELTLVLAGDGPARKEFESLAGDAPYIKFLGWITPEHRDRVLRASDVFVSPSFWEGSSRSIREAMLFGLPVLVGGAGGTPEIVRNGVDGYLLPVHHQRGANIREDLAPWLVAMEACYKNKDKLHGYGANGRERVLWMNRRTTRQLGAWMNAIDKDWIKKPGGIEVSILMPAYNAELYIEDAVLSCMAQADASHCPGFEIVIVNDGSTDNTGDIAERLAGQHGGIVVAHRKQSLGVNAARNRAALIAQGEALLPLDADDQLLGKVNADGAVVSYDWLERAWGIYTEHNRECLVYGRIVRWMPNESGTFEPKFPNTKVESLLHLMGGVPTSRRTLLPTVLHPRLAWEQVGGWNWVGGKAQPGHGLEDAAYNIELALLYDLIYNEQLCYHWRFRPASRSLQMDFREEWGQLAAYYHTRLVELGYRNV